ncbi:MAG: glycosyltransferase family 2 protein [Deltaproteobacteria bacterium]|nr:glycosyltransferase family 2 protein [Deltaproteobacteria bacterium]
MTIDVIVPVHNEGSIGARTLNEFYEVCVGQGLDVRFIVCEDGSTDDTASILLDLSKKIPLTLISSPQRKGYSRAVVDGLLASKSSLVACVDSDGQYDPRDFIRLVLAIRDVDYAIGIRMPRKDPLFRRVFSFVFRMAYRFLFDVRLADPSCPFLLMKRTALERLFTDRFPLLAQGLWWEVNARLRRVGAVVKEVPVVHRARQSGQTQVYRWNRIAKIAWTHGIGVLKLRHELG